MTNPLTEFLETPNLCPRCYIGTDDDHDGDCAVCAGLPENDVARMRIVSLMALAETINLKCKLRVKIKPVKSTRFRCAVCGKVTAGRVPVSFTNHRERGDGTFRYPRRHNVNGKPCPGNIQEAEWI